MSERRASKPSKEPGDRRYFIRKDDYLSPSFAVLENERVWPKLWQMACREQDLQAVGSFVTYEIADESIVIVRVAEGEIKAYYNVCQHRGRRILEEHCGKVGKLFCRYHGWRWKLDGSIDHIPEREQWGDSLDDADMSLPTVRVGLWQGWVFICMDPDAVSIAEYLAPLSAVLAPYRQQEMRYRWRKSVVLEANWKTAMEAFMEGYHAQCTHRHIEDYNDSRTECEVHGIHSMFRDAPDRTPVGIPAAHTKLSAPEDLRVSVAKFFELLDQDLSALVTPSDARGAQRLLTEVQRGADLATVLTKVGQFQAEEAAAEGIARPEFTYGMMLEAGQDWSIFPNMVLLPGPDSFLIYRARPDGSNVNRCRLDIIVLQRFAPGAEPTTEWECYDDWKAFDAWPKIFLQDFPNISAVQAGMRSRGFRGSPANPVQERCVANFHQQLRRIMFDESMPDNRDAE